MKNIVPIICCVFLFLLITSKVYSQDTAAPPPQPPWYFYWPKEDPENFQKSTLGESTLNKSRKRRSNVEVNRPKKEKIKDIQTPSSTEGGTETETTFEPDSTPIPVSDNPIYKWKDENGVMHMTNDLGSVPAKYRDQVIKESE